MTSIQKIAVLGGGISGLSSAYYASKKFPNAQITVYEKEKQLGGAMQTKIVNDFVYDIGPRSLRNSNNIDQILRVSEEAGILDDIIPASSFDKVFIYYNEKMRTMPRSGKLNILKDFIMDNPELISNSFKMRFSKPPQYEKGEDITIKQFLQKTARLGPLELYGLADFLNDTIANAVFQGIYRATPDVLSKDLCLSKVYDKQYFQKYIQDKTPLSQGAQEYKDQKLKNVGSLNFKKGLGQLPIALEQILLKNNVQLLTNTGINSIEFPEQGQTNQNIKIESEQENNNVQTQEYDIVISTLGANILQNTLTQQTTEELQKELQSIKLLSLATTNIGYSQNIIDNKYASFGALVPDREKFNGLGLILNSCCFPQMQPQDTSNISLFFSAQVPKSDTDTPQKSQQIAEKCLDKMIQVKQKPDYFDMKQWDNFFPVYSKGHFKKAQNMMNLAQKINPNFYLHGNYLFCGAIPDLMLQSEAMVNAIEKKN